MYDLKALYEAERDYKVPAYVFWFEKFPMNASGKIELKELRKEAAERAAKQRETAGGTQE